MKQIEFEQKVITMPIDKPPFKTTRKLHVFKYKHAHFGVLLRQASGKHTFTHIESGHGFARNLYIGNKVQVITALENFIKETGDAHFWKTVMGSQKMNLYIENLVRKYLEKHLGVPVTFKEDEDVVTLNFTELRSALKKKYPKTFHAEITPREFITKQFGKDVIDTIVNYV